MSELKATRIKMVYDGEIYEDLGTAPYTQLYYRKEEVDKVISELEADYKEACGRLQTANLIKDEQLAATRHHKFKRCVAMAKVCKLKRFDAADYRIPRRKWDFYDKWLKRWRELAEKFKEAK